MIISGVVFGYLAGITYWFPKIFGFTLNERIGRYAFWCWLVGFILAFVPLYILGLMGATRRLDHYSASLGWQPLFIVAAVGAVIIVIGVLLVVLQYIVSFIQRKQNLDTTGDPWNGRTLEWSTPSPAPPFNFAVIPEVTDRDAYWATKQARGASKAPKPVYEDIIMPSNSGVSVAIGILSIAFGFGMIWHIYWLSLIGLFGVIVALLWRNSSDVHEYTIPAAEVAEYYS
jgi:cytochrome o ubiquinol oxidase subunit 1